MSKLSLKEIEDKLKATLLGVAIGDTLKEIETITEKLSREEAINLVKKVKSIF